MIARRIQVAVVCLLLATAGFLPMVQGPAHAGPIELAANMQNPEKGIVMERAQKPWAEAIEKGTGGKAKIMFYWSGGLGNPLQNYDLAKTGVADIGWTFPSYYPGRFPMTSVTELPFLFDTAIDASRATWELYEKYLNAEYKDVHMLTLAGTDPTEIWLAKKPVYKLEDLKGLRIRVAGAMPTAMIKLLGATPVFMPITEVYEALQKGIVDGVFVAAAPIMTFRLQEVLKYGTKTAIFTQTYFYVMNQKKWSSLPPDVQKVVNECSGMRHAEMLGKAFDAESDFVFKNLLPKAGVEVYTLPPEERERWKKAIEPIFDSWVKEMEGKGVKARDLLEEIKRLSAKYAKK